ncbi:hypothetical protein [Photobacterium sanguinicancri]|nr:hypothetical protein [Photobacterium sanguinicancri]MDO6542788.1 hypothetical protein [Photobacterium sanguinicancri]
MLKKNIFSVGEVADATQIKRYKVSTFVQFLLRKGALKIVRAKAPYLYAVKNDEVLQFGKGQRRGSGITHHRKVNKPRRRMWNTMRVLRKFSRIDLMMAAEVASSTVSSFTQRLEKAGYIRKICLEGNKKGECAMYLLVRNTGPDSPVDRGKQGMWDVNEQKIYPFKESANE